MNCDTPESTNVNLRVYCIGNFFIKSINKHLLHLKICPQASGTPVLHCKQMCLIDNELTDCGGKWISNDTNSFKVVPEGAIDSVEICIMVRVFLGATLLHWYSQ